MKTVRIVSWVFQGVATSLALYSFCVTCWLFSDLIGSQISGMRADGAPNLGAGVGAAIILASGLLAAALAYLISHLASPTDRTGLLWRWGKWIRILSIIAFWPPVIAFIFYVVRDVARS